MLIPVPTIETDPRSASATTSLASSCGRIDSTTRSAGSASPRSTVNVMSVRLSTLAFCTIVSTETPASASGVKSCAATPGRSGTPRTVIFAIASSCAMPRTLFPCSIVLSSWISVPGASLSKVLATRIGTP